MTLGGDGGDRASGKRLLVPAAGDVGGGPAGSSLYLGYVWNLPYYIVFKGREYPFSLGYNLGPLAWSVRPSPLLPSNSLLWGHQPPDCCDAPVPGSGTFSQISTAQHCHHSGLFQMSAPPRALPDTLSPTHTLSLTNHSPVVSWKTYTWTRHHLSTRHSHVLLPAPRALAQPGASCHVLH